MPRLVMPSFFTNPNLAISSSKSFGPAIVSGNTSFLWLYFVAPIVGMLFGLLVFLSVKNKKAKELQP